MTVETEMDFTKFELPDLANDKMGCIQLQSIMKQK